MAHDGFDSVWHKALGARLSLKLRKNGLTTGSRAVVSAEVVEGGLSVESVRNRRVQVIHIFSVDSTPTACQEKY